MTQRERRRERRRERERERKREKERERERKRERKRERERERERKREKEREREKGRKGERERERKREREIKKEREKERKKERKKEKKNVSTETGSLPQSHAQELFVIRVRGNPSHRQIPSHRRKKRRIVQFHNKNKTDLRGLLGGVGWKCEQTGPQHSAATGLQRSRIE